MDFQNLEAHILSYLDQHVKESRKLHSLRTADVARKLCVRFGEDEKAGYLAGIAHDMMKDMPLDIQWQYAQRWPALQQPERLQLLVPVRPDGPSFIDKIIHGPAASVYIFETWNVENPNILEAIACHASAAKSMSRLSKIIYAADKLEPGRAHVSETIRAGIDSMDLDELFFTALASVVNWLSTQNAAIAQTTLDLYNSLTNKAGK